MHSGWEFPSSNLISLDKGIIFYLHISFLTQIEYTEQSGTDILIDWTCIFFSNNLRQMAVKIHEIQQQNIYRCKTQNQAINKKRIQ
jgi:hypothetical protein